MTPSISVIVPVYNTGDYLKLCIDSILDQDFSDFELILVDDGSTDESPSICDHYAKQDSRIKCIHKENGGVIKALALGVHEARGRWVAFVDHDDTLPSDALTTLYTHTGDNSDIIIGFSYQGDGSLSEIPINDWRRIMVKSDVILCTRWAKLYRRAILLGDTMHAPSTIKMGEDMIMNIKASFNTEKPITVINSKVYNYNRNHGSFSVKFKRTSDWCGSVYDEISQIIEAKSPHLRIALIQNGVWMVKRLELKGNAKDCKTLANSGFIKVLRKDISNSKCTLTKLNQYRITHPGSLLVRVLIRSQRAWEILSKKILVS